MDGMTVDDIVGDWLLDKGFHVDVVDAFAEQEMDGTAIVQTFGTCSGPDCLKEVVSKFGVRMKVYTAIKAHLEKDMINGDAAVSPGSSKHDTISVSSVFGNTQAPRSTSNSVNMSRRTSLNIEDSDDSSGTPNRVSKLVTSPPEYSGTKPVPNPFPIPFFRDSTTRNLMKCRLVDDDRKYMVRVLSTMLCTFVPSPSMKHCEIVAVSLHRKYSFLKESNSWKHYIYTRCQNINRKGAKDEENEEDTPKPKRLKLDPVKHVYASLSGDLEDNVSITRNNELLKKEIAKAKPKPETVRELIKRTLASRRNLVMTGTRPDELLNQYPHLRKANYIFYEFDLIIGVQNSYDVFTDAWMSWKNAILEYSAGSVSKPKMLKHALRDIKSDDYEAGSLTAMRCLAYFLIPKSRKKSAESEKDIPHVMMDAMRGTPPGEVVDKDTNQPHLLRFVDEDLPTQYFLAVEQIVHLEVSDFMKGIFLLLALHYVYDIQYHHRLKDIYLFLEDKLLGLDSPSCKKSAPYLSVTSAIECYIEK